MASKATYKIVAIAPGYVKERMVRGAPRDGQIIHFALRYKCGFVARYFPSRKGWMVLDVRRAIPHPLPGGPAGAGSRMFDYIGVGKLLRVFPSEDAAVMWAMHQFGAQVVFT